MGESKLLQLALNLLRAHRMNVAAALPSFVLQLTQDGSPLAQVVPREEISRHAEIYLVKAAWGIPYSRPIRITQMKWDGNE